MIPADQVQRPIRVLLVDDNESFTLVAQREFERSSAGFEVQAVSTGGDALRFLQKNGRFREALTPDLILLDIGLPDIDGFELLRRIVHSEELASIPVIMVTSSGLEADRDKSIHLGARGFITKQGDMADTVREVSRYWVTIG